MGRPIDRRAVDQLVVEHLPAALRFARRLVREDHVAEDLVQEALCRVLRQWRSYRGEATFRTWLLSIVVNVDRDRRRRVCGVEPIDQGEVARLAATPSELAVADDGDVASHDVAARAADEIHALAAEAIGDAATLPHPGSPLIFHRSGRLCCSLFPRQAHAPRNSLPAHRLDESDFLEFDQ